MNENWQNVNIKITDNTGDVSWPNYKTNKIEWPNNIDNSKTKAYEFSELEQRINKIEKLLSKIEHFLNKFFDTDINKEDE